MIVRGAAEQVTQRMERKGPDVRVVRVLEHLFRRGVGHRPVDDGALRTARDENIGVKRVPGDR